MLLFVLNVDPEKRVSSERAVDEKRSCGEFQFRRSNRVIFSVDLNGRLSRISRIRPQNISKSLINVHVKVHDRIWLHDQMGSSAHRVTDVVVEGQERICCRLDTFG